MRVSVEQLAALLCLFCLGVEVQCDCTRRSIDIIGGDYSLNKELGPGSLLVYRCPEGFYPYPVLTRTCQPNGSWRPPPKKSSPQTCKRVKCPDPFSLENGNVSPAQDTYLVGNETTYECYSGYRMRGSSNRTCLPNGKWSGSTPICSRDSGEACPDPGVPPGASRTGNMFGIDDKVKYTCNSNMILVGSSERMCLESGQWTGKEPACYFKHTFDTPQEVSEAFGSAIKDSLTTMESLDDTQEGRMIRISKSGTLNIYIAVDISESIDPEQFKKARDAIVTLIKKIARFSVSPNYEIIFFSSEVYEVVNILDFFDKRAELKTVIKDLEKFEIGDRNSGTDLNLAFVTFEKRMSFIKERVGLKAFEEHRHVLIMFTDGAYNLGGSPSPTVEKIKNMVYMNHTVDKQAGSRDDYLDIYVFAIGADIFDEDLVPLTVGTDGKHYFRMKDITELRATFDEIIDEREVVGLCGLYQEYETTDDKFSRKRQYPWLAFVVNKGVKPKTCFGALVSPDFVLTAAHCFTFGDLAENVVVEIEDGAGSKETLETGAFLRRWDPCSFGPTVTSCQPNSLVRIKLYFSKMIKDPSKTEKRVKSFTLHPNYNIKAKQREGVEEFYDYDVALVRLMNPIQISNSARSICIPCTQETSDALNLVGESTCEQQEKLLLKDQLERLHFLTKREPLVAEKDVAAKLGANRDLCIKKALKAPGINATNAKVAVTDNFLCTGGVTEFRNHIACKGDSGGAVFKNYQLRTIQIGVVSWGTHNLCGSEHGLVESNTESRDFHINLFKMVDFLKANLGDENQDYTPLKFLKT